MRVRLAILITVVLLAGGLSSSGQPQVNYGPFVPTQEWGLIMKELLNGGTRAKGVADMRAFAERNKGTTLGAHALATAGVYCGDNALYRQLLQQIVVEYPNSTFSLQAQVGLFELTPQPTTQSWISAREQFLRGFGAPAFSEVMRNRRTAVLKVRALPLDTLEALMPSYLSYAHILRKSNRFREAIEICQFGEEATFQKPIPLAFYGLAHFCFSELNGGSSPYDVIVRDPQVRVRSPQQNRKSGPRPYIRFDVQVGDYRHAEAADPKVWLDGQDISSVLEVQTKLSLKRKTGPSAVYRQSRYSYRPPTSLTPGRHLLSIRVETLNYQLNPAGPGKTEVSLLFFVDSHERDEGPEDDDLGPNEEKD